MKKMFFLMPVLVVLLVAVALVGIAEENAVLTHDEMLAREGTYLYVMEGDTFIEIPDIVYSARDNSGWVNAEDGMQPLFVFDRSRQQLVVSSTDENFLAWLQYARFRSVVDYDYAYPVVFDYDGYIEGDCTKDETAPIDYFKCINGKYADDFEYYDPSSYYFKGPFEGLHTKYIEDFGWIWVSANKEPMEVTFSKYQGTRCHEATVRVDTLLYSYAGGYGIDFAITNNGYFLLNTSHMPEGVYHFNGSLISIID